jgi:hypothetical protein
MTTNSINKCQYWNIYEPHPCIYWDSVNSSCKYKDIKAEAVEVVDGNDTPSYFPHCNYIGTALGCTHFKSSSPGNFLQRCILPDPSRHVCNRKTGKKWVSVSTITEIDPETGFEGETASIDFSLINGYNDGSCDGKGTDTTCSGYSPYHMGFGILKPSDSQELDTFSSGHYSSIDDFGYQLPINFTIYNIRAVLSKCYWWKADPGNFIVTDTGEVELGGNWECTCPKDTSVYSEFTTENGPPCNGCKSECPNYTGVCWQYCTDDKMETGDPILVEQIHELRYYHREHNWTKNDIEAMFMDEGTLFAWYGTHTSDTFKTASLKGELSTTITIGTGGAVEEYRIPAVKVFMPSFDEFTIESKKLELTQGTEVSGELSKFPTLIRELQLLPLAPIIKTEFNKHISADGDENFLFETPYLTEEISTLIYGKSFYSEKMYAMNISDSELQCVLPTELYYFDNVYDIQEQLNSENYEIFNENLVSALTAIKTFTPDKIVPNSLPDDDRTFLMDVSVLSKDKTYDSTNDNTILVYQEVDGVFTFDKITFTKRVVGGMLFQDTFEILGDGGLVRRPIPDFEQSFMTNLNKNGNMSFHFEPFVDAEISTDVSYIYNDIHHDDPVEGFNYVGSKKYKITIPEIILETSANSDVSREFKVIGSNGYCLISLNNTSINNVIENWEAEKILVEYEREVVEDDDVVTIEYTECEMEIVHHGGDRKLSGGQVLIKPKNMEDFSSICGATVKLINVSYIEKRSFDQSPEIACGEYEEVDTTDNTVFMEAGEFDGDAKQFTIKNYKFVLTLAAVMQDSVGRAFTMSRTKPIGMVKQVACPDVEIFYKWSAKYSLWQNLPICTCCGARSEKWIKNDVINVNTPMCGDHFECKGCYPGPMWWPYNECQGYVGYNQVTNLDNWDLSMIGLFKEKDDAGEYVHGSHDMRMLGPHKRYAYSGVYCPPRPCSCPMLTYNEYMTEEPYFTGYGKVRAGVSEYQIAIWEGTSELPVMRFGNELRSVLRSYRTTDQAPYIVIDKVTGFPTTEWKLMPAAQMFSKADITSEKDAMWDYFCGPDGPNVSNPLGFYTATEFDGISIDEELDYTSRFRFEDIINVQNEFDLGYPKTTGSYVVSTGDKVVTPFYNFKKHPYKDKFIQWAWQEFWKPIKRNNNEASDYTYGDFIKEYIDKGTTSNIKGTYLEIDSKVRGKHLMLDLEYPDYKYDWQNKEFRLVCDENMQGVIKFNCPVEKDQYTGEYLGYPSLQLNNGPKRGINWAGDWLTVDNQDGTLAYGETIDDYNVELYEECIGNYEMDVDTYIKSGWSDQVTLFDTGYDDKSKNTAKDEDRMCLTMEGTTGDKVETHFQRGLNVRLVLDKLNTSPLKVDRITQLDEKGEFMEVLCGTGGNLSIGFTFDEINRTVGRLNFSYVYGPKKVAEAIPATEDNEAVPAVYKYFHKPAIEIYSSPNGNSSSATLLHTTDCMVLYDGSPKNEAFFEVRNETVEWENTWDYIANGDKGLYIVFRTDPTSDEIAALNNVIEDKDRYHKSLNAVSVLNTQIYEEKLTNAEEYIENWERKYYVSYGESEDGPPQGKNDQQVLTDIPQYPHSVWQVDNKDGVSGISNSNGEHVFINKCRGRFVFDVWEDETLLDYSDLSNMENLQYKLYNQAAEKATGQSIMNGILPPGLHEILANTGVGFLGAKDLSLKNTLISTLADINQFPIMQPEGHSYISSNPWTEGCSGKNNCYGGDTFAWRYTNMDDDSSHTAADSFSQYYSGTYWMMQRREMAADLNVGLYVLWYSRNTSNNIFPQEEEDFTKLVYPELDVKPVGDSVGQVQAPTRGNPSLPFYWGGMWGITSEPIYGDNPGW